MRLILTTHVQERMAERSYTRSDVEYVLSTYHTSMPGTGRAVKYIANLRDGRRTAVVLTKPLDVTKSNVVKTIFPVS